ncbi:hypothetical protein Ctha_2271 [Chloroherpeton thalassium ATCC 35110]|uniref:Uncharacterized protein n=1 Tax=Chloroherpeton thalassium (strain ATCC 35110 / GB-78) TaxID=517418 RepID=B3QWG2_CHLT3|nr:hypothetical protein Ctha_2271 [Chloroherpeton thalassium ATCC 35110]
MANPKKIMVIHLFKNSDLKHALVALFFLLAVFLATGCGSSKESQQPAARQEFVQPKTQAVPAWFKVAQKKSKKAGRISCLKSPGKCQQKIGNGGASRHSKS